jgi:cobalt-zinc-cadmium efflux system outer membrane protein
VADRFCHNWNKYQDFFMHTFKYLSYIVILTNIPLGLAYGDSSPLDLEEPVIYSTALKLAIERDPRMGLAELASEAAEGRIDQANLRPNPVVGAEVENFLGTGPVSGIHGLEVTIGISQVYETAGKREKRTTLARVEREQVEWQRELILAEIETDVRKAFVSVLLAQELVSLREQQLALAERSASETARLVEAARSPQVELARASLAISQQRISVDRANRQLASAQSALASLWGVAPSPEFTVAGDIGLDQTLPSLQDLISKLQGTAPIAQFEAITRSREAALEVERALAKPDFEVFGGGRYFNENSGDVGFVFGIEIPWPIFDKNQGNIRTARAQVLAVQNQQEATSRNLFVRLSRAYQQLTSAHAEANAIESDLIVAAEQTLTDTEVGYQRGQFTLLAVLESRQTLFDVREAYLDAIIRYAEAKAEIEALTRPATIN